jgi:guanine deaminase
VVGSGGKGNVLFHHRRCFFLKQFQVGLGTDVSGGYSPSLLTAIQHASMASKVIALQSPTPKSTATQFSNRQLPVATLLYLATLGGAQVCDLQDRVGSFAPGKSFDALVVDVRNDAGNPGLWGVDGEDGNVESLEVMLERFLFCGDDRNISQVYVQGRLIGGNR